MAANHGKMVKWYLENENHFYLENENPEATEHIKFVAKKGIKVEGEKKYVKWLRLHEEVPLKFFPRVKTLEFNLEDRRTFATQEFSENYFNILPSLRRLESLIVENGRVLDEHLVFFSKLKKVGLRRQHCITDEGLMNLEYVQDLGSLVGKVEVGTSFESLKNLRDLNVSKRKLNMSATIQCFPRLRKLNISGNMYLMDAHLKLLTRVERLNISKCKNVTDKGLQNLPINLRELCCWDVDITNIGISRFKGLEVLEYPFYNTKITVEALKQFKEIKKLSVILQGGISIRRIIEATSPSLRYFSILDHLIRNDSSLSDDDLKLLAKLTSLRTLNIQWSEITDEGLKNIAHSCKKLRKLELFHNKNITEDGLKQLNVSEVIVK